MHGKKLITTVATAGLLLFGVGVSGAVADENLPAAPPPACSQLAPGGDESDAANAVSNAADNVSQEADNQQGDDEQGDQQDNQSGNDEQGDCNDEDNGDQGDDDGDNNQGDN